MFNENAMVVAANAIQDVCLYGQLHYSYGGTDHTENVTDAARVAISWATPTGLGDFELAEEIAFTGGDSQGDVFSLSLWDADTAPDEGNCYGEFPITNGDLKFSYAGTYKITAFDTTGMVEGEGS